MFYHRLEKTGNHRRSKKHGKSQIGVYQFLHLHPSNQGRQQPKKREGGGFTQIIFLKGHLTLPKPNPLQKLPGFRPLYFSISKYFFIFFSFLFQK
jgi:hypothetical protein